MATRRERVVLELEDNFTSGMAKAAAATALLDKNLDHLSGSSVETTKSIGDTNREVEKSSPIFTQASKDIDRYSGRLRLLTEAAVTLGPALVPIGAVAVPAVIALASGLTAAAAGAGVAVLAFHGVGDALKALDAYQLDPSTAHLEKMRQEFEKIGPTGVEFVKFLDRLEPELKSLQEVARTGLFPGVEKGIASLLTMFPQVRTIIFSLATELGHLAAEAGTALSGDTFSAFFDYLETDAAPTLAAFAHTLGNVGAGIASLLVDFAPLSRDFSSGMEAMSKSFADWSANLSQTDGFRDFVAYVRESGPQVLALLGSLATAFIDIAQAAAPVGALVVPGLTALAKILGTIASSPIGGPLFTAVAAMLALNRATLLVTAGLDRMKVSATGAGASISGIGKGVIGITAVIAAADLLQNAFDKLADTSVDQGNLGRSIQALANGKTTADIGNLFHTFQDVQNGWQADWNPLSWVSSWDPSGAESAEKSIKAIDETLAQMVESGDSETAAAAFANLAPAAKKAGLSLSELTDLFPEYQTALDNAGSSTDAAAVSARKIALAHNRQAASADAAAASTASLVSAMQDETEAALGAFDAETQYRQALKDAAAQAKKNDAGIRGNTAAVLNNRSALSGLAGAWNNQSNAVKNSVSRYHEARKSFIDLATGMGVPIEKAQALAKKMLDIPKSIVIKQQNNLDPAVQTAKLLAQAIRNIPTSWLTNYTINTIRTGTKPELHAPAGSADGTTVPKTGKGYADRHLYVLADGEEVISNRNGQADRHRPLLKAINAGYLAGGGTAGGDSRDAHLSLDDRLAIVQALQQIRDLRRSLALDGKKRIEGYDRKIAQLQILAAEREIRLAQHREEREARQEARDKAKEERDKLREKRQTLSGIAADLSFDSLLPSVPQTVAQGVGAEIADFKKQILDAGGVWTKSMRKWAADMQQTAKEYDHTQKSLEREQAKRDELVETLADQQQQLDQLNSTMASYSASVAGNFLTNGFNGARTDTVAGAPGAATAALASAQAQLAALRSSSMGDSVALAAQAAELIARIKDLQKSADAETADTTKQVSGLQALRETLLSDTDKATRMSAALKELADKGLDTSGDLGGLYSQLAASGDVATAEELANLSAQQIDEYEKLFKAREDAAALVAAQATQAVYGQQQQQLIDLISQTNAAIAAQDATIAVLNAELAVLGEQVRVGAEAAAHLINPQLRTINQSIQDLAGQQAEQKKKDKV